MTKVNAAYTEPKGTFPGYINVEEHEDGSATIIVRTRRASLTSQVTLPKADFEEFRKQLAPAKTTRSRSKVSE